MQASSSGTDEIQDEPNNPAAVFTNGDGPQQEQQRVRADQAEGPREWWPGEIPGCPLGPGDNDQHSVPRFTGPGGPERPHGNGPGVPPGQLGHEDLLRHLAGDARYAGLLDGLLRQGVPQGFEPGRDPHGQPPMGVGSV